MEIRREAAEHDPRHVEVHRHRKARQIEVLQRHGTGRHEQGDSQRDGTPHGNGVRKVRMRRLGPRWAAAGTGQRRAGDVAVLGIAAALFVAALIHAVHVLGIGWKHAIFEAHAFRQTQTAISVYWMLQGGPLLAYHTPVLGYPWAIPLEFPLYQWLVAGLVAASGVSIETAGRTVGVAFFF